MKPILVPALAVIALSGTLAASYVMGQSPSASPAPAPAASSAPPVATVPGMPPVADARNVYSETAATRFSPAVKDHLQRVYVPNLRGNNVSVIDPATMKVVDTIKVGLSPQHVVP